MSFILEALKKSESERQRQSGPALFEVKVAPPRPRFPVWAAILGALLVVNLGVVAWVMLRKPQTDTPSTLAQTGAAPQPESVAPAATPAQVAMQNSASAQPGVAGTPAGAYGPTAGGPVPGAPGSLPPGYPSGQPATGEQYPATSAAPQYPASPPATQPWPASDPALAARRAPELAESALPVDDGVHPDDLEPARPAPPSAASQGPSVVRGTQSGVPTYEEVAARSGTHIPELRLELHSYSPEARGRFVFINSQRLREGESLAEGVVVENITPDGATLSYRGTRFMLLRD